MNDVTYKMCCLAILGSVALCGRAGATENLSFMAVCDPPKGYGTSYGDSFNLQEDKIQSKVEGIKQIADSYSNMKPAFFIRPDAPMILYSSWGTTIPNNLKGLVEKSRKVEENPVLVRNNWMVAAYTIYTREVWLITLYPTLGAAHFTRHKLFEDMVKPGHYMADGVTMMSTCVFR